MDYSKKCLGIHLWPVSSRTAVYGLRVYPLRWEESADGRMTWATADTPRYRLMRWLWLRKQSLRRRYYNPFVIHLERRHIITIPEWCFHARSDWLTFRLTGLGARHDAAKWCTARHWWMEDR